jgi:hypothetical protein
MCDERKDRIFKMAASEAYSYCPNYQSRDYLTNGIGYWVKFDNTQDVSMSGQQIDRVSIAVGERCAWNMIGSISSPVATNTIIQNPPGIVKSNYFGYSCASGYFATTTILPGKAYWVKVSQPGELTLNAVSIAPKHEVEQDPIQKLNRLLIEDATGNCQQLYFGQMESSLDLGQYELPPTLPDGAFDARFANGRIVEVCSKELDKPEIYSIIVTSTVYPITISWDVSNGVGYISSLEYSENEKAEVKGKGSIRIDSEVRSVILKVRRDKQTPAEFALYQNYPNPFNPTTTFKYQLPTDSRVKLTIYNVLGQVVSVLLDEIQESGYKSLEWDGGPVASGMYFCRLDAVSSADESRSFSRVMKLLLLK